nr:hypothetical protein [Tanacetum cinerariifolium]
MSKQNTLRNTNRTYDIVNGKWKTVRPKVATFYGVYANTFRTYTSGDDDDDYIQRALTDYQRRSSRIYATQGEENAQEIQVERESSFNTRESGDGSFNLNITTGTRKMKCRKFVEAFPLAETKPRGKRNRERRQHVHQMPLMWNRWPS